MLTLNNSFEVAHELDGYHGEINGYFSKVIDGLENFCFCIFRDIDGWWTLVGWCEGVRRVLCKCVNPESCVKYLQNSTEATELAIYKEETPL